MDNDQAQEEQEVQPEAEQEAPVEETQTEAPQEEDRSAYNCDACKGEGLLANGKICLDCNGTGKK